MRALLLGPNDPSAPSNRARLQQYLPSLTEAGVDCHVQYLFDVPPTPAALPRALLRRIRAVLSADRFDVVVLYRELWPLPARALDRALRRRASRLIFDFDDAIYLDRWPRAADGARLNLARTVRGSLSAARRAGAKFRSIVPIADVVIAGNDYLAARAQACGATDVRVIPTPVDTDRIRPRSQAHANDRVVVGWMGSPSTAPYLDLAVPGLREVLNGYPQVRLEIVGARWPAAEALPRATARPWRAAREARDLASFDIGIMPLPDNEWTRGKCAYKLLQYMAAGAATVSSPVGTVPTKGERESSGLLAASPEQWGSALRQLVGQAERRQRLGACGRSFAVDRYSIARWAPAFVRTLHGHDV